MSCHLFVIILWENMGLGYVHFCAVIRRYWYVIIGAGVNILPHAAVRCHVFSSCRSWKWVDKQTEETVSGALPWKPCL